MTTTKQRDLDVERALRSQLRRANDLLAQSQSVNADMLAALREIKAHAADYQRMQIASVASAAIARATS